MDTLILTPSVVSQWRLPAFQRPLRINEKVRQIAEEMKIDQVVPGVITIGVIEAGPGSGHYVIDGQHRIEAFRLSDLKEVIADVRIVHYESMAAMGKEFVELNSRIVNFKPDDVLRGLEEGTPALALIRERCSFVGYGNIKRSSANSSVLSMSMVLRAWVGSSNETPVMNVAAATAAVDLRMDEAEKLCDFLLLCFAAWGRGEDSARLWSSANLILCMWLWRRMVLAGEMLRPGLIRYALLKPGQFRACLMSLGANRDYCEWLVGRNVSDRDRGPTYSRIKSIFTKRMKEDGLPNSKLPQPTWDTR
jgi:hypothetical protein